MFGTIVQKRYFWVVCSCILTNSFAASAGDQARERVELALQAAANGEVKTIERLYLDLKQVHVPREDRDAFVAALLESTLSTTGSRPQEDATALEATLAFLGRQPEWRTAETEQYLRKMFSLAREWPELDVLVTAAARRAEGQLSAVLRERQTNLVDLDGTIEKLRALSEQGFIKGSRYHLQLLSVLAARLQESVFWIVPFDTKLGALWTRVGNTDACTAGDTASPCARLALADEVASAMLEHVIDAGHNPHDWRYFLVNDYVFSQAMIAILSGEVANAEQLLVQEIIENRRNQAWFDTDRPLDHVFVYKFIRDPSYTETIHTSSIGSTQQVRSEPSVSRFFNPVHLAQRLREQLNVPELAAITVMDLNAALLSVQNRDYRVVIEHFDALSDPNGNGPTWAARVEAVVREFVAGMQWEQVPQSPDAACGTEAQPTPSQTGSTTWICRSAYRTAQGTYEGYDFVGGFLSERQARDLAELIAVQGLPTRPYVLRPPLKG